MVPANGDRRDPEEGLPYKMKRVQFNHRIPTDLKDMFEDFGDDKKYLLEYFLYVACKYLGDSYATLEDLNKQILEKYISNVREYLTRDERFSYPALFSLEQVLKERILEGTLRRAEQMELGDDPR